MTRDDVDEVVGSEEPEEHGGGEEIGRAGRRL